MSVLTTVTELLSGGTQGGATFQSYTEAYGNDSFGSAVRDVVGLLPDEELIGSAQYSTTLTGYEDSRILQVKRLNTAVSPNKDVICRKLSEEEGIDAADDNSIYHIGADEGNFPAYYVSNNESSLSGGTGVGGGAAIQKITVLPNNTGASVLYITTNIDTYNLSAAGQAIIGVPGKALFAIAVKTALNIVGSLLAKAIIDEEDVEMMQMLQAHAQSLQGMYASELNNLGVQVRGEAVQGGPQ